MLRENKLTIFTNLILVMLMSASICQTLYTSLFMTDKLSLTIFIAILPLSLLFWVMLKTKVTSLVSAIIVCILLIVGIAYILFEIGLDNALLWINIYSTWLYDVGNGFNDSPNLLYTNLTIIALAFIITLSVYIFSMKIKNFYITCIFLFSVFFVQLQYDFFKSKLSFILFIFSFLLYYFLEILRRRNKEISYDFGNRFKYLIYIIPVSSLVVAIAFLFPIQSDRIKMPWLDTRIDSLIESVVNKIDNIFYGEDISNFDYFSINSTGFGSNDRLGGNIKLSKTHVMNVKSQYSNLYLKASSKAFYNGHGWYDDNKQLINLGNDLETYSSQINLDYNELITGNFIMTGTNLNDAIFKPAMAEIEYVNLKTKSLFIPVKTNSLILKKSLSLFYDNEQMISASDVQNNKFGYVINYNNIMLNSDDFKKNIRKSYKGFYSDNIESYLKNYSTELIKDNSKLQINFNEKSVQSSSIQDITSFNVLNDKIDILYRKYTQLPDAVTTRVHQLAKDLTDDKTNAYDKAKAIENYLSKNYPYTLTPGNSPLKKDFVDYFLFEGKKGYCTYYASAMTVLLRCVNIPARYVEGYILPPDNEDGVFKVTNQQAHAWVEVYFEGFGWIPFEPTSPFVANMYNDKNISASVSGNMMNSGYDDYLDMIDRYRNSDASISYGSDDINTTSETKRNTILLAFIIISSMIGVLLLAFCILVLFNKFRYYRILRKIRKSNPNSAVLIAYAYILRVLDLQNVSINAGETPTQFGIRAEKTLDFKSYSLNKTSFTKITSIYVNARYSKVSLDKDDQQELLNFIFILLKLTNEKIGKFKFTIARNVFGKI